MLKKILGALLVSVPFVCVFVWAFVNLSLADFIDLMGIILFAFVIAGCWVAGITLLAGD